MFGCFCGSTVFFLKEALPDDKIYCFICSCVFILMYIMMLIVGKLHNLRPRPILLPQSVTIAYTDRMTW